MKSKITIGCKNYFLSYAIGRVSLITYFTILLSLCINSFGQYAPVTTIANITASPGQDTVQVPVTATGVVNIMAVTLRIEYNPSVVTFAGLINIDPGLAGIIWNAVAINPQRWKIMAVWSSFTPFTLAGSGSGKLFDLKFAYHSGNTPLEFNNTDNGGIDCEWTGPGMVILIDEPTGNYYIDGNVCGTVGTAGPINGNLTPCAPDINTYTIDPIANATSYWWTVSNNLAIVGGQGTTSLQVSIPLVSNVEPATISVQGMNVCTSGNTSSLQILIIPTPQVISPGIIQVLYGTSATIYAPPGGPLTYSYYWQPEEIFVDPHVQNPQTIPLTSSVMITETVTDLEYGCVNTGFMILQVIGGPVQINPTASPPVICQEASAVLSANVSGGFPPYTYAWTCYPPGNPPWSSSQAQPVVSPVTTTTYFVTVTDGYTSASGSVILEVIPKPPQPTVSIIDFYLVSSAANGNQWYNEQGMIPGATGQTYLPQQNGNYYVIVTENGCSSDPSNTVYYNLVGVQQMGEKGWIVYPNPAGENLIVSGNSPGENPVLIKMFNMFGQVSYQEVIKPVHGKILHRIHLQGLISGLYIITIHDGCSDIVKKVYVVGSSGSRSRPLKE